MYEIDTRMAGYTGITAGYLIRADRPCLVETGTAPSAPVVRDALAALGIGPADLATVVVTHIHLDHAGGVGDIAAMYPAAEIVVHERGARHLADPTRLMNSARQVYGTCPGQAVRRARPDPRRAHPQRGGTRDRSTSVAAGGWTATTPPVMPSTTSGSSTPSAVTCTWATRPGCTSRRPGICGPATPPPGLRPGDWRWPRCACSRRCARRGCCSATTGRSAMWPRPWSVLPRRLNVWVEETRQARSDGLDLDHAVAMVQERTRHRYAALSSRCRPGDAARFERVSGAASNVAGILHWLGKSAPAAS